MFHIFTVPQAAAAPTDAQKDKDKDVQPAPDAAQEVVIQAEVHSQDDKNYPLDQATRGEEVPPEDKEEDWEEEDKDEEEEEEELPEDDENFEKIIEDQVKSGHLKKQVQAGNCIKWVIGGPGQAGNKFKAPSL